MDSARDLVADVGALGSHRGLGGVGMVGPPHWVGVGTLSAPDPNQDLGEVMNAMLAEGLLRRGDRITYEQGVASPFGTCKVEREGISRNWNYGIATEGMTEPELLAYMKQCAREGLRSLALAFEHVIVRTVR